MKTKLKQLAKKNTLAIIFTGLITIIAFQNFTPVILSQGDVSEVYSYQSKPNQPPTTVRAYHYDGSGKHRVIAKYSDILNQAIIYKKKYPHVKIEMSLALFQIHKNLYVNIDRESKDYSLVKTKNFGDTDVEKLIYTIRRAGEAGIDFKFVYHNPEDDDGITEYLGKKSFYKRITWGETSSEQMHNKFLIAKASTINAKDKTEHVVWTQIYVSTANADDLKRSQTGVLVQNHSDLYSAYNKYFTIIWKNHTNLAKFRQDVRAAHASKVSSLNYSDDVVSAYFFPIPTMTRENPNLVAMGWSTEFNPIAQLVEDYIASKEAKRLLSLTAYMCGSTAATPQNIEPFCNQLSLKLNKLSPTAHGTIWSVIHNTNSGIKVPISLKPFDGQDKYKDAVTHEKNLAVGFYESNEFYSVTGSANFKQNEYTAKANNMLMIKESGNYHPVFNLFIQDAFERFGK